MNLHIHPFSTGGKHGTWKEPRLKKGLKLWVLHIFLFFKFKTVHCTIGVQAMHQQIQRKLQHEWPPGSVQKGRMSATSGPLTIPSLDLPSSVVRVSNPDSIHRKSFRSIFLKMGTHHLQHQPKIAILAVSYQETQKKRKREKELWVKP
jgi:hypothetical protein